ncbi:MAG: hypothetical protein HQL68_00075 [Magnetococcales bacterium]|nr:hypothetical protein [Magnetococcales bacterium]
MKDKKNIKVKHLLNFAEGYAACIEATFEKGYEMDDECPYEPGSFEEQSWHNGWEKAKDIIC